MATAAMATIMTTTIVPTPVCELISASHCESRYWECMNSNNTACNCSARVEACYGPVCLNISAHYRNVTDEAKIRCGIYPPPPPPPPHPIPSNGTDVANCTRPHLGECRAQYYNCVMNGTMFPCECALFYRFCLGACLDRSSRLADKFYEDCHQYSCDDSICRVGPTPPPTPTPVPVPTSSGQHTPGCYSCMEPIYALSAAGNEDTSVAGYTSRCTTIVEWGLCLKDNYCTYSDDLVERYERMCHMAGCSDRLCEILESDDEDDHNTKFVGIMLISCGSIAMFSGLVATLVVCLRNRRARRGAYAPVPENRAAVALPAQPMPMPMPMPMIYPGQAPVMVPAPAPAPAPAAAPAPAPAPAGVPLTPSYVLSPAAALAPATYQQGPVPAVGHYPMV